MSRLVRFAPLLLLALLIAVLAWRLAIPPNNDVRSKLEGQRVPEFSIPAAIRGKPGLTSGNLAEGQPRLLNIFASWCVPCISEARVLGALHREGVPIDGIAVRDRPQDVARFLADHGDPYRRIGSDAQSAVQIALGSSGVPESFVIDGGGVIRYQHIGPIEERDIPAILAKLEAAK
jgi:cytochrome c biogenesis protein CcmG/thiol:disulfide interchange protein DsbE